MCRNLTHAPTHTHTHLHMHTPRHTRDNSETQTDTYVFTPARRTAKTHRDNPAFVEMGLRSKYLRPWRSCWTLAMQWQRKPPFTSIEGRRSTDPQKLGHNQQFGHFSKKTISFAPKNISKEEAVSKQIGPIYIQVQNAWLVNTCRLFCSW